MRVKIWGARGSIPAPMRPEELKEKIIAAMLSLGNIADHRFKEELLAAMLEPPPAGPDEAGLNSQAKRRKLVAAYVDSLPPLLGSTAGGNTPCVEVRSGEDLFIIDAGSGIRDLGQELMKGECGQGQGVIHLFFSHPHWDHIQGFPFFRPAFIPGNRIFLYGVHDMAAALRRQQESISFPISLDYMQAELNFIQINPEVTLEFGDLSIRCLRNHHPGDAYSFRFEKGNRAFVYASDAAYPPGIDLRPYLNFFAEADVLIYDAQFMQRESDEKEDWGHSSSLVGVEMAQQAGVKNLVLFHYDPMYADEELRKMLDDTLKFQQNQYPHQEPVKVMVAQEGQTFDLSPTHLIQLRKIPGSQAAILKPNPIFDERTVAELRTQLLELQKHNTPPQLIIDMARVEMLQITGLRALVKLKKEQPGIILALAGPATNVQQLIDLAGYSDFFTIYPSVHMALSKLQAHETLNLPGQMLKNRYYIEAKRGDGRLGTVFKATDTRLNRPVAIKVLSPAFSEAAIEQFLQHGRQIVDLTHPNIIDVYDCDQDHGLCFMVEELVESKTLREIIDENSGRPLALNTALTIAENIATALEYAHAHGVIHGDLKPKNVLLADRIAISDFGLGRLESGKPLDMPLALVTAHYLAPEQILGHPIDARTDLYALGVILYEMFTGQCPFEGSDPEILEHHRSRAPRPPRELNPAISYILEHLILKLLDKDPTKRYATARQVRRILDSMSTVTGGEREPQPYTQPPGYPLIGRAEPLQQLQDLWAQTRQGQGRVVFMTGELGIGKTRLAQELALQVEEATILIGQCQKLNSWQAYQPFIEAIQAYLANLPPGSFTDSPPGQVLAELAAQIPQIQALLPETIRQQLLLLPSQPGAISLAQSIAKVAARRPWLLILDDLQWADRGSLNLLRYLAAHCAQMPLLIIGIYQNNDGAGNNYLPEILDDIQRQTTPTSIVLTPFSQNQVMEMLSSIWAQTVSTDLATTIYRRTRGNPLFIKEIARTLMDENVVSWRDTRWHFGPIVEASLPTYVSEAVLRRSQRLPQGTQMLLNQAAVLGSSLNFADLHEMSAVTGRNLLDSLDAVLERQFMYQSPGETMLHFEHIEIQQVLYENLNPLKRPLMHREAGEALERRYLSSTKENAARLAYHFFQAGALDKGLTYSIQAAERARALYDDPTAAACYSQALDTLDQLDTDRQLQQQRFELLLAREEIYGLLGNLPAQAADLAALENLAHQLNDPVKLAGWHNRRANFYRLTHRLDQAKQEAEAGLEAPHPGLQSENLIQLARLAIIEGQFEAALEHLHAAQKLIDTGDYQLLETQILNELTVVHSRLNDYSLAENYCRQAMSLGQTLGNWRSQAESLENWADLHFKTGRYSAAIAGFRQALEIYLASGDQRGKARCLNQLEGIFKELGQLETAQAYAQQALSLRHLLEESQGEA
ncbi:MAG: protein kinase [Chloroflexota bacterium]